jgi:hypothetical protein
MNQRFWVRGAGVALVGAIGLVAVPSHSQPGRGPVRDMLGVRLGMPVPEAKAALDAHKPPFTDRVIPDERKASSLIPGLPGTFVATYRVGTSSPAPSGLGTMGASFDRVSLAFAPPPGPNLVLGIGHVTQYNKDAPTVDTFIASLKEKFGPPMNPATPPAGPEFYTEFDWAWNPAGAPLAPFPASKCIGALGSVDVEHGVDGSAGSLFENYPDCGVAVKIVFHGYAPGILASFDAKMVDIAAVREALKSFTAAKNAAAGRAAQQTLESARGNKPQL